MNHINNVRENIAASIRLFTLLESPERRGWHAAGTAEVREAVVIRNHAAAEACKARILERLGVDKVVLG